MFTRDRANDRTNDRARERQRRQERRNNPYQRRVRYADLNESPVTPPDNFAGPSRGIQRSQTPMRSEKHSKRDYADHAEYQADDEHGGSSQTVRDSLDSHNRPESILKPIYEGGYSYNAASDTSEGKPGIIVKLQADLEEALNKLRKETTRNTDLQGQLAEQKDMLKKLRNKYDMLLSTHKHHLMGCGAKRKSVATDRKSRAAMDMDVDQRLSSQQPITSQSASVLNTVMGISTEGNAVPQSGALPSGRLNDDSCRGSYPAIIHAMNPNFLENRKVDEQVESLAEAVSTNLYIIPPSTVISSASFMGQTSVQFPSIPDFSSQLR